MAEALSLNKVSILVGGKKTNALLDTGASICVANKSFIDKTKHAGAQYDDAHFTNIRGVTGNCLKVLGMVDVELRIGGNTYIHPVHVIDDLDYGFVLGVDFLQKYKVHIDFGANQVVFPVGDKPMHICLIQSTQGLARNFQNVVLPKRAETNVLVQISRQKHGKQVLLEPRQSLALKHIVAAKCLVKVNKSKAYLRVLNPTHRDITLPANEILATVSDIEPASVFTLSTEDSNSSANMCETNNTTPTSNDGDPTSNQTDSQSTALLDHELPSDFFGSDLTTEQKSAFLDMINRRRNCFAFDNSELGKTDVCTHHIETLPGTRPVRRRPYHTNPASRREIDRQVEEMIQNDIIEPSNSGWHSPVLLVKKPSGEFRFVVDYRDLNKSSVPQSFPLPQLSSVFDALGESKAQWLSSLDLKSGFWQIGMDESSKHKAAFITQSGVYEWKRMPFGLMNAPITFQTLMTNVLRDINWRFVLCYIDDILIFSPTFELHLQHIEEVLDRLQEANLKLHPSKCHFAVKQLKFLGHVISRRGVEVDPDKTEALKNFPAPRNQKEVRRFIGMANYYRKFIKDFASKATPLNSLLKKGIKFEWSPKCQEAFESLKHCLLTAPVLSYPDPNKSFTLTCDASDNAISYILGQPTADNKEQVIAYGGKALSAEEKKYSVTEKELLAVVKGVEAYRPYLCSGHFKIYTDNKALVWLQNAKHTGRLERWALRLQEYDYKVIHKPGKQNCAADALSRIPYPDEKANSSLKEVNGISASDKPASDCKPNTDCEVPPSAVQTVEVRLYYSEPVVPIAVIEPDNFQAVMQNRELLFQHQSRCPDFRDIINFLQNDELPDDAKQSKKVAAIANQYCIVDQVLFQLGQNRAKRLPVEERTIKRIALPRTLRKEALHAYHDNIAGGGHLGIDKVRNSIQQKYFWPRMNQDIIDYIRSCDRCQRAKRDFNPSKPPLAPLPRRDKFECWQIDILGPLFKTPEGYQYVLLCIDAGSRWPEAFPLKTQDSREVADVLFTHIFSRYGCPSVLLSDRGRNFMSNLINALCEIMDIRQHHTSSYHPSTNGVVERQNSTLAQSLRAYCAQDQSKWPKLLPGIMMAFRKSPSSSSTELAPFQMLFGQNMRLPFDVALEPKDNLGKDAKQYMNDFLGRLRIYDQVARDNDMEHQARNKQYYDRNANIPDFRVGDQVLMKVHNVRKGLSKKLCDKSDGPYQIIQMGPNYTYKLRRISNNKVHPNFINATNLKKYYPPVAYRQRLENVDDNVDVDQQDGNSQHGDNIDVDQQDDNSQHGDNIDVDQQDDNSQHGDNVDVNQPDDISQHGDNVDVDQQDDNSQHGDNVDVDQPDDNSQCGDNRNVNHQDDNHQGNAQNKNDAKTHTYKKIHGAKFKGGERLFRVEWMDGTRTWEPDKSFDDDILKELNREYTKSGKKKKTFFRRSY